MKKRKKYSQYPVRMCLSLHHCEICNKDIIYADKYYDGGYGRRAHKLCADADELKQAELKQSIAEYLEVKVQPEMKKFSCPFCDQPINLSFGVSRCPTCEAIKCVEFCIPGGNKTECIHCGGGE